MEGALITRQRLDAKAVHFDDSATKDVLYSKGNGFYIRQRTMLGPSALRPSLEANAQFQCAISVFTAT